MNRRKNDCLTANVLEVGLGLFKALGAACIAKYRARYKYMYIYNDIVFKVLFGTPENEKITVDFLNRLIIGTVFVSKIRKMKFFTRLFALLQEKAKLSIQVYL